MDDPKIVNRIYTGKKRDEKDPKPDQFESIEQSVNEASQINKKIKRALFVRRLSSILIGILSVITVYLFILNVYFPPIEEVPPLETAEKPSIDFVELGLLNPPLEQERSIRSVNFEEIDAEVVLSFDPETFQVYAEKDIDKEVQIASITKLMTTLIVLEEYDLKEALTAERSYEELGWILGIGEGDSILVEDLLVAMLISSYNDAAYLVAESYPDGGYDGFIRRMNSKASDLGMKNSKFENPIGFDHEDNYSTANDLRKLIIKFLMQDELLEITSKPAETVSITRQSGYVDEVVIYSTNKILEEDHSTKGLKTGYTQEAGLCFVGYFVADEGDDEVVTIVLNASDRFQETTDLLNEVRMSFQES